MGNDLEREVFGGSESELSDDEEDIQQQQHQYQQQNQQQQQQQYQQQSSASSSSKGIRGREEYESSAGDEGFGEGDGDDGDSEDEYVQERTGGAGVGKTSKVKAKKTGAGGALGAKKVRVKERGEEGEGKGKVQKKRKRKQPGGAVGEGEGDVTGEGGVAPKKRMDQRLDEMLKKTKKPKSRKKKNNDEVLDSFADDEVSRLREMMNNAVDEDIKANSEKMPAYSKLRMLPEAMETLRKASLAQSMIDNNLLEAVRRWLEPLSDKSLPALNIQRELFNIIKKMEFIDSSVLKESGLGRIVLFYTKCKRVTPDIARIANDLVSIWSRPIIKRSASYRDRIVPVAEDMEVDMRAGERLNAILARAKEMEKGRVKRNAVMIPQRELGMYTVAPRINAGMARVNASVDMDVERRRKNAERLKSLTRKVNMK